MIVGLGLSTCIPSGDTFSRDVRTELMGGFPDGGLGYDLRVSGCYAGKLGDSLIMAGGCNLPDKPFSERGSKRYYRGIYVTRVNDSPVLHWVKAGNLSVEAAYGATVSLSDRLIFIGGSSSSDRLSPVLSFSFDRMKELGVACEILPSLPCMSNNMSVVLPGGTLYVSGGHRNGIPSCSMFSFCLSNYSGGWTEALFPGKPRVQLVCASLFGNLYIWGGFIPGEGSSVLANGLCCQPASGQWQVPRASLTTEDQLLTLTGGASVSYRNTLVICVDDVNQDIFEDAISSRYKKVCESEYPSQLVGWYHFNDQLLACDVRLGEWIQTGASSPMLARAGASLALFGEALFYVGEEFGPGVRTSGTCRISFQGQLQRRKQEGNNNSVLIAIFNDFLCSGCQVSFFK